MLNICTGVTYAKVIIIKMHSIKFSPMAKIEASRKTAFGHWRGRLDVSALRTYTAALKILSKLTKKNQPKINALLH